MLDYYYPGNKANLMLSIEVENKTENFLKNQNNSSDEKCCQ